uniref:DNA ligase (ATP) n=1 Tax=Panagrolaimus sp. ES5 TaxID=591445 RepID=A0AC34FXJ4_9BILA
MDSKDSKHKWTFNDFVTRVEELSNTPKRFRAVVFKTFLREFEFATNDSEEYGIEVLKDIFFPEGTIFTTPFPDGLLQSLLPTVEPSLADEDKTKIRDDQIQQIIVKMESQPKDQLETPPMFVEVLEKLKSFCHDDLKLHEAIKRLEFIHNFDCLGIEWIIRILTCTVQSKLESDKGKKTMAAEMLKWFNETLEKPLNHISSIIGQKQSPMLLLKMTSGVNDYNTKILKFCGGSFYVETKYDGERFQVHKMRNSYKFFSRNGIDYTEKFGRNSTKEFAEKLHPLFKEDVFHCLLDCEIMVWDRKLQKLIGKNEAASDGVIYDVKNLLESKDDDNRAVSRVLCVFDILHLNGVDLNDWTLSARLRVLDDVFDQDMLSEDLCFLSKYTLTMKRKDFIEYYNQAMEQKLEGIVIKSLYSTYLFGSRAQANGWYKIKPDYGSAHTLDLGIIGVRMDKDNKVHAFNLGALISKDPLKFQYVGAVSGYIKHLDRARLLTLLKGETGYRDNNCPAWVKESFIRDRSIRYIDIKNIVVVEIRASGVMRGQLRFASVVSIRGDKDPIDCDTVKDVEEYEATLRKIVNADNESGFRKRKRKIQIAIPIEFKKFHSTSTNSEARTICCYNIKDSVTPHDLDELTNLGFSFISNLAKDCVCVVTDEPNSFKIKGAIKQNICHIVKGEWLKRCREHAALVAWQDFLAFIFGECNIFFDFRKPEDIVYDCPNATFSLFEDSPDVQRVDDGDENNEDEDFEMVDEAMTIEEELDDVVAADSDPEFLLDGLNMNDGDEEM